MRYDGTSRLLVALVVSGIWFPALVYLGAVPWVASGPAPFTMPVAFVAMPLVAVLRRRLNFLLCAGFGTISGALGAWEYWDVSNDLEIAHRRVDAISFVLIGFVSGAIFWAVGVWRKRGLTCVGGYRYIPPK
jgi:hypothetical protein